MKKNTVTVTFAAAVMVLACVPACSDRDDAGRNGVGSPAANTAGERTNEELAAGSAANTGDAGERGIPAGNDEARSDTRTGAPGEIADQDRRFVTDVASAGMMEVELGRVAAQKGENPDVKSFGQHMTTDHTKANDRLKTLASRKGIDLPREMNPEHRAQLEQLSTLSGTEFDRRYMEAMVKAHEDDINKFQQQTRMGQDSDVKQFADETLPTLREHLAKAQSIDKEQDAAASANDVDEASDANADDAADRDQ